MALLSLPALIPSPSGTQVCSLQRNPLPCLSAVQLVGQFTAIGTPLAQALLLKHRLPWTIWPAAALMTGGAAMVIVPTFGQVRWARYGDEVGGSVSVKWRECSAGFRGCCMLSILKGCGWGYKWVWVWREGRRQEYWAGLIVLFAGTTSGLIVLFVGATMSLACMDNRALAADTQCPSATLQP
jgi:drug/metabolite transporter (DMT)-like permease